MLNFSKSFLELPLERFALLKAYFFLRNFLFLAVRLLDKSRHCKQSGYNSLDLFLSIYQTFYSFLAIKPLGGFKIRPQHSTVLFNFKAQE